MKKVFSNLMYQSLFQIVKIIIPIITIPIVSNALGPKGIGTYNYTNSVAQYFILLASLGMALYGNREVATHRNNKLELSRTFWELELFSSICSTTMLLIYILIAIFLPNRIFFLVQGMSILAVMFDISWFFMGLEKFKYVSLTNLIVQLCTFALIILNIKSSADTLLYIAIQSGGILASAILMWVFILNKVEFVPIKFRNLRNHLKPTLAYFIPQVSITIYTNLNKTILGAMSSISAVGFFSNSLQLANVAITLITTLDVVLLPQMSRLFADNNQKKLISILNRTLHLQLFFSIPTTGGLIIISSKLVPWFFGDKFLYLEYLIPVMSILIIIIPMGMSISRQYLIPIGHIKEYNISVIVGAGISVILNCSLIPIIGIWGAIIGSIVSELFVTITRVKGLIIDTGFKYNLKKISIYFLATIIMMLVIKLSTNHCSASLITTILQIIIGFFVYLFVTFLFGERVLIDIIKRITK